MYLIGVNKSYNKVIDKLKKDQQIWDLFTKKDEYPPVELDKENRYEYISSKHRNVLNPTVSEYLINNSFSAEYPDDKKFAVVLTHDVDNVYVKLKEIFASFGNCFKYGNFKGIRHLIRGKIKKEKSPYINFQEIINLEDKYNAKSTFFFLVKPDSDFGNNYYSKDLEFEINKIIERKCEIGYHTRYHIYEDVEKIKKEKRALEKITECNIAGVRNHHLRFNTPISWEVLEDAGFKYDTTFHYHNMVGFRNGMCHPFYPYNRKKDEIIDILEIPLIISDIALRSYMKINPEKSWKYIKNIIDITEKNNGVLAILWHNWTFSYPVSAACWFSKDWTKLYNKILSYCSEKNAWITNCKELYDYDKKESILKSSQ